MDGDRMSGTATRGGRMTRPERIDLGVLLLDKRYGRDWPAKVNLDTLDLSSGHFWRRGRRRHGCVLCQVYGRDWTEAIEKVGLNDSDDASGMHHGFNRYGRELWGNLTAAWVEKITELRRERGL